MVMMMIMAVPAVPLMIAARGAAAIQAAEVVVGAGSGVVAAGGGGVAHGRGEQVALGVDAAAAAGSACHEGWEG